MTEMENENAESESAPVEVVEVSPAADDEETAQAKDKKQPRTWCHVFGELHLRIFAWGFMVLSQMGSIMCFFGLIQTIFQSMNTKDVSSSATNPPLSPLYTAGFYFSFLQYCMMPLILIANFSEVFRDRKTMISSLRMYGGGTIGVFLVFLFVYLRYAVRLLMRITGLPFSAASAIVDGFLSRLFTSFRQLNFFVDLFICSLIAFFILYKPKKFFQGKKIHIFRSFVIIPFLWSIVGYILLGLNKEGTVIPGPFLTLLPLKPPMFLLAYTCLVLYLKKKERHFFKSGKPEEEYDKEFLSPQSVKSFSVFASVTLGMCSLIDLIIIFADSNETLQRIGFGDSSLMFLVIPIIIFFDFSKGLKNSLTSVIIPVVAVVLIVVMWIEAIYWLLADVIAFIRGLFSLDSSVLG